MQTVNVQVVMDQVVGVSVEQSVVVIKDIAMPYTGEVEVV